jgi:hypothetical protein
MADTSTVELLRQATERVGTLVRDEVALVKAEIAAKARTAAMGLGLLVAAAAVAFYLLGAVLVTIGLALATAMPEWASALIITGALLLAALVLALVGVRRLRAAKPPIPEQAISSIQADVAAVGTAIEERNQP